MAFMPSACHFLTCRSSYIIYGNALVNLNLKQFNNPIAARTIRFHRLASPVVHPKLNSGKESIANAEFGMRNAECVDPPPVHFGATSKSVPFAGALRPPIARDTFGLLL
jgi:hypothetical protein